MARILYAFMAVWLLLSCQEKELSDINLDTFVYMPQAGELARKVIATSQAADTTYYGASVNGFAPPEKDVVVVFSVDEAKVGSYNDQHGVEFELLPAAAYTLAERATISKGSTTTEALLLIVDVSALATFKQDRKSTRLNSSHVKTS